MNTNTECTYKDIFQIPLEDSLRDLQTMKLLQEASLFLGEVKHIAMGLSGVFDHEFIVSTLKNIESLDSAKIEGTTGNLKDLYQQDDLDFEKKKQLKLFSAINYRKTIDKLEEIAINNDKKISLALIRHIHKLLTEHDPATTGESGKFRDKPVMILNSKLGHFYPASEVLVKEFMEQYIKDDHTLNNLPSLFKIAIQHVKFECIHPFEDGNGRTGRVLINIALLHEELISKTVLNLSDFFEKNRDSYITNLRSVTETKSYKNWIQFFLTAVIDQSKKVTQLIKDLKEMRAKNIKLIEQNGKHAISIDVLDYALNKLFINIPDTAEALKHKHKHFKSVDQLVRNEIKKFMKIGILNKTNEYKKRSQVYIHSGLADLLFKEF